MSPTGPRFLDEEPPARDLGPSHPLGQTDEAVQASPLPRGPMLLDAAADAPERIDVGWMPEAVLMPRVRIGTGFWFVAGLCVLGLGWVVLSAASFVLMLLQQSRGLGGIAAAVVLGGCAMLGYAALLEARAYRSLNTVERLRALLAGVDTSVVAARAQARAWLAQVGASVADRAAVDRMLADATTLPEIRGIMRSQVADRLRETADGLGSRAAIEGATLVAVCPHPAWDGLIAGVRGLLVIRRVAALYGLRPGFLVTVALVRQVAWTAAGTTGLTLLSQSLADQVLGNMPVFKHVAGALPGTGAVAVRLYRLAGVTAEACSPTPR